MAVLPYRIKNKKLKLLLVTTRGGELWIIPKGNINRKGRKPSALQEAVEEAGALGGITTAGMDIRFLGKNTRVYPMKVKKLLEKYPEAKERKRRWVTPAKALKLLTRHTPMRGMRKLLQQLELIRRH